VASTAPAERLHELFMDLMRVGGMLLPDQAISGHPVSVSQAFALHELDTERPLSQRDLAERLRLEKSSVSRMAAEMERKGLLVRERDPVNRRVYRLRLTDRGRALHASMASAFREHYVRWVAAMTPVERDALLTGLSAFVRVMRDGPGPWKESSDPWPTGHDARAPVPR
jgi:DNA-binding MarR family transcriptional regulator